MCKLHRETPPTKGKYFASIFAITSARNSKQASPQATGGISLELVQTASAFALHYVCHITAAGGLDRFVCSDTASSFCVPALNQQLTLAASHSVLAEDI